MEHKQEKKRKEKGQSLIELALLVPLLLIILAGILDLGRLYFAFVAVADAAGEGAAYAALHPDPTLPPNSTTTCPPSLACDYEIDPNTADCTCERALNATGGLIQPNELYVEIISSDSMASGKPIKVRVEYGFILRTPILNIIVPGGVLPLSITATEVILPGEPP
jgi:hypothetical protein